MSTTASATLDHFVDGELVDPASGATTVVLNPATGEELAQAPDSGPEDVDRAVAAARGGFEGGAGGVGGGGGGGGGGAPPACRAPGRRGRAPGRGPPGDRGGQRRKADPGL